MKDDFKPIGPAKKFVRNSSPKNKDIASVGKENLAGVTQPNTGSSRRQLLLAAPKKIHWWLKSLSRQQLMIVAAVTLLLIGGAWYGLWTYLRSDPVVEPQNTVIPKPDPPPPTTVASRMTGMQVAPELNNLPSTGVMIENSPDARPQAGLIQADLVYEAIAEGGITRFLALFQESQPDHIGPVRSVRPYYLDFLKPYDAALAHAGGSAEALAQIRSQGIKDLDHGANGSTYSRVNNRFAPHNLYTSRARLLEAHNRRGYTSSSYSGLARKAADTPSATPNARSIDLNISSYLYNPHYDYDSATNTYKRSLAGKPHTDERSGAQISPKVVVALAMSFSQNGIYSVYGVNGGGVAYVFQDGIVMQGTWSKADRNSQLIIKDSTGAVFPLNPGQTWISLVKGADKVTFAP